MKQYLQKVSLSLIISSVLSMAALSAEEAKDLTQHPAYPAYVQQYKRTNLDISLEEFDQKPIKEKILYLGFYKLHFDENGLSERMVKTYVSFLHNLFPHLKERNDTKVWSDFEKRYGRDKNSAKVLTALRPKKVIPIVPEKKPLETLKDLALKAHSYQVSQDYEKALPLWQEIYEETKERTYYYEFRELNDQAFGKRLDLKRLIRVKNKREKI
jgi:hypothetical protein